MSAVVSISSSCCWRRGRTGFDADQHRAVRGLPCLQRRGVLERVRGHDAVVVVGRGDEHRRVAHTGTSRCGSASTHGAP